MQATAYQNVRCRRPIYSINIYCRRSDRITQSGLCEIASGLLRELGLFDHQALIIGTAQKSPSVHVVVNRINPNTCKARELSYDHLVISKYAQRMEEIYGLAIEQRRRFNNAIRKKGLYLEAIRYQSPFKTRWDAGKPKAQINRSAFEIAWTTSDMEDALEYCLVGSDWSDWVRFSNRLAEFGLVIEWKEKTFLVLNPINDQNLIIDSRSQFYGRIHSLFDTWAKQLFQLLPITKQRRELDNLLRNYFETDLPKLF